MDYQKEGWNDLINCRMFESCGLCGGVFWEVVCVRIFLAFLILCIPYFVSGRVLLNEVYYDHDGRDEGHEFIELINTTGDPVDLGGYALEFHDGASSGWDVVWRGDYGRLIPPGGLILVGGEDVVPAPDYPVELGLHVEAREYGLLARPYKHNE